MTTFIERLGQVKSLQRNSYLLEKMKEEMKKDTIKWLQMDNAEGTATLSQHGLKPVTRTKYGVSWESNISLCGKAMASDNGETGIAWIELEEQALHLSEACKTCLRIYNKLPA